MIKTGKIGRRCNGFSPILVTLLTVGLLFLLTERLFAEDSAGMTVFSQCMEQVYDASNDQQIDGDLLNCTANDIQIAYADNITFGKVCSYESDNAGVACASDADCTGTRGTCVVDSCSYPGDRVTFNADFHVVLNAQQRHDIGLYFATDGDPNGDGALRGDCSITTLPEGPTPPYVDLDTDCKGGSCPQPTDQCGDIDDAHSPMTVPITGLSVVCIDSDGDGKLNLPNCTSWRQPGANELCSTPEDAFPGAPSKCNCDLGFNLDIDVPAARLDVVKFPSPSSLPEPGGDVKYAIEITNRSPFASVTLTEVADDVDNNGSNEFTYNAADICDKTVLAAGETTTCRFDGQVMGNANEEFTDRVTATGVDENQNTINGSAEATVMLTDVPSSILTEKNASPDQVSEPGGDVTYTVTVTNTSAVDDVTITSVDDPNLGGDISAWCDQALPATLAPGGVLTCTVTQLVSGNAGDTIPNMVIAKGTDDDNVPVQDSDSADVMVMDVPSSIVVKKIVAPDQVPEPGGDVTYTVTVTNDSIVDYVTINSVVDPNAGGDISDKCDQPVPAVLAPGGVLTCTVTQHVSGNAGDSIQNTVVAYGVDDDGVALDDSDTTDVMIADVPSSITTEKTASPTNLPEPGGNVTYTVVVTNTSAVDQVTITSVDDPNIGGDISGKCDQTVPAVLAPGGVLTCTVTQAVSGNAGDSINNTVIAMGTDDDNHDVQDTGSAQVTISDLPSSISVRKTANPTTISEPGADVTYTVVVTNTSAVDHVTITSVNDPKASGDISDKCDQAVPAVLAPGAALTCTVTQPVSGNAGDVISNTATANGTDDDNNPLQASDSADVTITDVPSSILTEKTASPTSLPEPGGTVTYTVTVTNTSAVDQVTITNVDDPNLGGSIGGSCNKALPASLAPGEVLTCTVSPSVSGNAGDVIDNTAIASGTDDDGSPVEAADSAEVTITDVPSSISVRKTASPGSVSEPGGDVTYTVVVTNTSAVDQVTITSVTDPNAGGDISDKCNPAVPAVLAPGEVLTCTMTKLVSGDGGDVITNTATANGTDDDNNAVQASDSADVTITDVPPSAHLTKTATQALVTFEVVVVNDSSAEALSITALNDDKVGDVTQVQGAVTSTTCSLPHTLSPKGQAGDTYTCSFNAVVNSPLHVNTVTATVSDNENNSVSPAPSDSATVELK